MEQFLQFISHHWLLFASFVIILVLLGANEMHEMLLGLPRLKPQQLTELMNHEQAQVIDLRTKDKFKDGHILGSKNIPQAEFLNKLEQLEKDKPIILVCATGHHAPALGKSLSKQGFAKVSYLQGGLASWQSENLPLEKA